MRVLSIFGTRPEAIKMAPVVLELAKHAVEFESVVCVTAQHREMLDQILDTFKIRPNIDLALMEANQTLASLTARAVTALSNVLDETHPDVVLVQGDTTTAMVAGLAAFYQKVPVGHVEAGLRTKLRYSPFPEEMNRRLLGVLGTYHFAPTERAAQTLHAEGVPRENVFLTGNTIIDALSWISTRPLSESSARLLQTLGLTSSGEGSSSGFKTILVTAHRRENFGAPLGRVCTALRSLVERNPDIRIVYPVHLNPNVRDMVFGSLSDISRVHLLDPLPYESLVRLMERSYLILTDSGGLQEEGPALGKPVLVLREETERPEGVEAGTAKVVGTDPAVIIRETEHLLRNAEAYRSMASAISPYGDGHAAERIVRTLHDRVGSRAGA